MPLLLLRTIIDNAKLPVTTLLLYAEETNTDCVSSMRWKR